MFQSRLEQKNNTYCYRYLKENFTSFFYRQNIREKKDKENVWLLLNNIVYAILDINYNETFTKIVCFNEDITR